MADAGAGPAVRDGVRRDRRADDRSPRRRRDFLRPPVHHDALRRREQPADLRHRGAQYSQLQNLGGAGLTIAGVPALAAIKYEDELPTSAQWNGGMQFALPWSTSSGRLLYRPASLTTQFQTASTSTLWTSARPSCRPTRIRRWPRARRRGRPPSPPTCCVPTSGYGAITQQWDRGWRDSHTLQWSFQRRFRNGAGLRVQRHDRGCPTNNRPACACSTMPDGSFDIRADQALADELLGQNNPVGHSSRKATSSGTCPISRARDGAARARLMRSTTGSSVGPSGSA